MKDNRLFVGNLSFNTQESQLQELFAQAGQVISATLIMDKFTGKSRGFAFVEMSTPEEAQKAVELSHGKPLDGRALTVNIARPREERPPTGGSNRGFRGSPGGGRSDRA